MKRHREDHIVRQYSDTLLIFLLKGRRPDVYRDRPEHSGQVGGNLRIIIEAAVSFERIWRAEAPELALLRAKSIDEVLYGGARGRGKSDSILAFQIARRMKYPGTSGLIIRRKLTDLTKQGALIPRSHELLSGVAGWQGDLHKWRFPNRSVLEFNHCKDESDTFDYQGAQYEDVCFDQAEQFTEWQFSVIKPSCRTTRQDLRPLIRCTANPGGVGHLWVKTRFVDIAPPGHVFTDPKTGLTRLFIPATVDDNPHLHQSIKQQLEDLPEPWRSAWRYGRWDVFVGQFFGEWDSAVHLCQPVDLFGMLDYGYAKPFCYLQIAISSDGQMYAYRELYQSRVYGSDQAAMIAEISSDDPPEYVVAGPDLWHESGEKGIWGQSTVLLRT